MIVDTLSNKKLNPIVTELFIRGRKLDISLVFIKQSYFAVRRIITLNHALFYYENGISTNFNKRELQRTASYNSSDIDFKDFMNLYKKCTALFF